MCGHTNTPFHINGLVMAKDLSSFLLIQQIKSVMIQQMGTPSSKPVLEGWHQNRNQSKELGITEWDAMKPKNFEYYANQRFCRIPRHLYPQYQKGYIYGYYEDAGYWKALIEEYQQ